MRQNSVEEVSDCILQCSYDKASVMAGFNETHCALCYYQINGPTLIASKFQGRFFFKQGKLAFELFCGFSKYFYNHNLGLSETK